MAYREQNISHGDIGYHPSDQELLLSYGDRCKAIMQQLRHDFQDHFKWWEHRGVKPCRICSLMDMLDYTIDSMVSVPQIDKKAIWKFKLDVKFDTIVCTRVRKN